MVIIVVVSCVVVTSLVWVVLIYCCRRARRRKAKLQSDPKAPPGSGSYGAKEPLREISGPVPLVRTGYGDFGRHSWCPHQSNGSLRAAYCYDGCRGMEEEWDANDEQVLAQGTTVSTGGRPWKQPTVVHGESLAAQQDDMNSLIRLGAVGWRPGRRRPPGGTPGAVRCLAPAERGTSPPLDDAPCATKRQENNSSSLDSGVGEEGVPGGGESSLCPLLPPATPSVTPRRGGSPIQYPDRTQLLVTNGSVRSFRRSASPSSLESPVDFGANSNSNNTVPLTTFGCIV